MSSIKKVLIIIPAYNEAKTISSLLLEIKQLFPQFTILVVNDGSCDQTGAEAERSDVLVVSHPFNLGIGGAVQTGFRFAFENNFDCAIQIDGDGQHDPKFLFDVIQPVLADQLDLSIGSRFMLDTSDFKSTPIRRLGIRFFSALLYALTGAHITDPTSGYRATGKKLIAHFASEYPIDFPEPEAIKIAKRLGARIGEVPVNMRPRKKGHSSIRYFATLYYMIKVTLAILIDSLKTNHRRLS